MNVNLFYKKLLPSSNFFFKIFVNINHSIVSLPLPNTLFKMKPPDDVRGLLDLDKKLFERELQTTYLAIKLSQLQTTLPIVKKYLLKLEKFKPVEHVSNEDVKIYLNPDVSHWNFFPTEVQNLLEKQSITENNLLRKNLIIGYENYNAEELLKGILPTDKEGLSSFTKIGHIVHVNLREHLLPFKKIIGEILYDKIPGCKSVVNKVNMIDTTYRYFSMELLKGDDNMLTTVKENNCLFTFDFSKVYWNSRLCTEHERIVKMLNENDVLFDVFAGVGPFSIPAAKKKCFVYANDLNPESFQWLNHNSKSNKIRENYFKAFNKDGRDFIKYNIKENLPTHVSKKQKIFITMNLPAIAAEFLDSFVGLFKEEELSHLSEPVTVFVYCFAKGEKYVDIAKQLVIDNFGFDVSDKISDIFRVRTVSSLKEMMRVTVKVDKDILIGNCRKRKLESSFDCQKKICNVFGMLFCMSTCEVFLHSRLQSINHRVEFWVFSPLI